MAAKIALDGAADHGVSQALYLHDPDQNGVELCWDRPKEAWPRTPEGQLAMFSRPLDVADLLRHAEVVPSSAPFILTRGTVRRTVMNRGHAAA